MWFVSYERYSIEDTNEGSWNIIERKFNSIYERDQFIRRIRDNVIVRRIWIK